MTQNAWTVIQVLIRNIWSLFNSWYIPGTNVTPAGFALLILFIALIIKFIKRVTFTDHSDSEDG